MPTIQTCVVKMLESKSNVEKKSKVLEAIERQTALSCSVVFEDRKFEPYVRIVKYFCCLAP